MGPSRTVSEIDGKYFCRKSQNFPTLVFSSPLKGFPLEFDTGTQGQKTRMTGLPSRGRSFSSLDTIHQRDGQTDGQTGTGRQQRPRLRIALRGKNMSDLRADICQISTAWVRISLS